MTAAPQQLRKEILVATDVLRISLKDYPDDDGFEFTLFDGFEEVSTQYVNLNEIRGNTIEEFSQSLVGILNEPLKSQLRKRNKSLSMKFLFGIDKRRDIPDSTVAGNLNDQRYIGLAENSAGKPVGTEVIFEESPQLKFMGILPTDGPFEISIEGIKVSRNKMIVI